MRSNGSARSEEDRPLLLQLEQPLNKLIDALYSDERTRPGYARLAKEIRETTGVTISATHLWELATEKKRYFTLEQLDTLARLFGVPLEYFHNDEVSERVNAQLTPATALRDTKIRSLALRAERLSPASLDALLTMVDEARKLQNLSAKSDPNSSAAGSHG
ncbi:hypothetical protein OHA98_39670 [Streptomyces sp. NBC_00654]|uniref:hypothetical protein n=1 Tax=Streptomyces sp. NBC_00654 TaxID=2975799 RepID=UPI00225371E2|nr:hypothetical protein [Streptomyces sp. NBC_00654]MCX4970763.1 hypothetical protein [Streptomyces sp. NBC_00654]MCX4970766.1 hypothetical protein [Streptomyces sp. NBC_00654]